MDQLPLFNKKEIGFGQNATFRLSDNTETKEKTVTKKPIPKTPTLSETPREMKKKGKNISEMAKVYETILGELRNYFLKNNLQNGIIGLSGGIDSCLTAKLAVDALGAENIIAAIMPEVGLTAKENIDHARELGRFLGIKVFYQPINTLIIDYKIVSWKPSDLAQMNTKARIRATMLYNLANTFHGIVLGTSNKSEILLGYGTKYGDLAADIEVIGDLYKTEVYDLARFLQFSDILLNKKPSAELKPNHTDEEDLGASYNELDHILRKFEEGKTVEDLIDRGINPSIVHRVARLMAMNKHKREMPPIINVHI
ncbi:NAD+ synthase [Candidatus Peregrinibacteria bacterium]|nr:NAD+ synthase [Candidatus Peregrinibacteria bacterium]